MKKRIKRLPKLTYLIWDTQDPESAEPDYYLIAAESLEDHASTGSKVIVGTYKLVGEDVVTLVTKISTRKVR